ncbi:MAG: hypothetical protein IJ743_00525 [Bacilli bacterium]|nr:hypothetical protein [Methanobrevibacter sp.]MBR1748260.1 hypothetical protein [Bacilli bacterium]
MALKAWSELTLAEKQSIRKGFIRNPHKAYDSLRSQAEGGETQVTQEPEEVVESPEDETSGQE